MDQLNLFDAPPRWRLTRPLEASRLAPAAVRRLDDVRRFFPELDGITIQVGRTMSRRAAAWASLDPARPTLWIKPGRLHRFTAAHELAHLLQARKLIPGGEMRADLEALSRHVSLIDRYPGYLRTPRAAWHRDGSPRATVAQQLHEVARTALAESPGRPRRAVRRFEELLSVLQFPAPGWKEIVSGGLWR